MTCLRPHLTRYSTSVRKHSIWFPDYADDIMVESKCVKKGVYFINNAQPAHYGKDGCTNVHGEDVVAPPFRERQCQVVSLSVVIICPPLHLTALYIVV